MSFDNSTIHSEARFFFFFFFFFKARFLILGQNFESGIHRIGRSSGFAESGIKKQRQV